MICSAMHLVLKETTEIKTEDIRIKDGIKTFLFGI